MRAKRGSLGRVTYCMVPFEGNRRAAKTSYTKNAYLGRFDMGESRQRAHVSVYCIKIAHVSVYCTSASLFQNSKGKGRGKGQGKGNPC